MGDIVELLQQDHEKAKAMLAKITSAAPEARAELFCELVPDLVSHEVAEEIVVYPTIRSDAPDGEAEAEPRLKEQAEAEDLLNQMEKLDPASTEFGASLTKLKDAVLVHASAEEENIFPLLRALNREDAREELGKRYEQAKSMAPTHPHPHAPDTPPGNVLLGPIAAIFDKMRDAVRAI